MRYGLHISTAGNIAGTPARAHAMGAEVMQIFASNPRGWRPTHYTADQAAKFRSACADSKINPVFIHMIYLASYGTPDDDLRGKSIQALDQTMQNADLLGVKGVITHLGSHKGLGLDQALKRLADALHEALAQSRDSWLVLENSAGAGGNIGNSLEELAQILDAMQGHPRLKVCVDTAHALTSGYEIRTPDGLDKFLADFDRLIGLDRLVAMHLNDPKADIGSHVDRHENIGHGYIGEAGFRVILNHPKLADMPGILEVPGMDGKSGPDQPNLDRLKELTAR